MTQGPAISTSGAPPPIVSGPTRTPDRTRRVTPGGRRLRRMERGPEWRARSSLLRRSEGYASSVVAAPATLARAPFASLRRPSGVTLLALHHLEPAEQRRLAPGSVMLEGRLDEAAEQRMAVHRPRLQLGMELARDEPRMAPELDHLDQRAVGGEAGEHEATRLELLAVRV